ncbi:UNVERIFIED_CONTAM: hypothetical protein K2H54_020863, partial [Gekko kuhli]
MPRIATVSLVSLIVLRKNSAMFFWRSRKRFPARMLKMMSWKQKSISCRQKNY